MYPVLGILKPDIATNIKALNLVMARFDTLGLNLEDHRMITADRELILAHYNKDEAWLIEHGQTVFKRMASDGIEHLKSPLEYGQRILDKKVGYMTSGPVIVLWYSSKDPDIYQKIAEAVGATEPISAQPGSLRYMLSKDSYEKADAEDRALYNSLHCSDSRDEGRRERDLWFPDYA